MTVIPVVSGPESDLNRSVSQPTQPPGDKEQPTPTPPNQEQFPPNNDQWIAGDASDTSTFHAPPHYKRTLTGNTIPYNRAYPNRPVVQKKQPLVKHYFRPSWIFDHINWASFKVASRTWVGIWFGFMLMMIPSYVTWVGRAPYLTSIIGVIVPAGSMSVTVCFVVNFVMMLFTVLGFVVMLVAMYINNVYFHNSMTSEDMARILVERGQCEAPTTDPSSLKALQACASEHMFNGEFLSAKGSVIYAVFIGTFMFFLLWVKNKSRILIPGYVCGVIAVAALMTVAPMVPYYKPMQLGLVLLKPVGLQCAINFGLSVIIFPFSSGFQFTHTVRNELTILNKLAKFHLQFMASSVPSNEKEWLKFSEIEAYIQQARQMFPKLQSEIALLHVEFTYSRFSVPYYSALKTSVAKLTSSLSGLVYFYDNIENIRRAILIDDSSNESAESTESAAESATGTSKFRTSAQPRHVRDDHLGRYETTAPVGVYEMKSGIRKMAQHPNLTMEDLDLLVNQLRDMSYPFVEELGNSLDAIISWLAAANVFRANSLFFFWQRKHHRQTQARLAAELLQRRAAFRAAACDLFEDRRFALFEEHDEKTRFVTFFFQGALYCGYMKTVADTIDFLFEQLLELDEKAPAPFWSVGRGDAAKDGNSEAKQKAQKKAWEGEGEIKDFSRSDEGHLCANGEDLDDLFKQSIHNSDRKRNPDAMPPTTPLHKFGAQIRKAIMGLASPTIFVPVKGAIFTVLSASPCLFSSSAPWFYKNKIMWMVIMTGLSISENMADNLYGFFARILYSFYAGVIAMVAWYISTGQGDGNRAGFMVVCCILYFGLSYYREFAQHTTPMPTIVLVVTTVIILGLSWTDGMKITTPSVGIGYEVAWKRFVTVVMGLTFGFVCSLVPRPVTGKRVIRKTLASIIKDTGTLYCHISDFGVARLANPDLQIDPLKDPLFKSITNAQSRVAGTRFLASMIQFEPSLQGRWPSKTYREVTNIASELVELHHHLYVVLGMIDEPRYWLPHLLNLVGWKNQPLMSHYFAVLYMAQGALYDGSPLPQVTPAMLMVEHLNILETQFKKTYTPDARAAMGDTQDLNDDNHVSNKISLERLKSVDGLSFSASIVLSNCIFDRMDRLMYQINTLVGEQFINSEYYRDDQNEKIV